MELGRQQPRYAYVRSLSVACEGSGEEITLRAPDISSTGMFINIPNHFPEGTVLRVSFRLPRSNFEVIARCEVRYCLPGVGVGVEFIEISPEAQQAIDEELQVSQAPAPKS
jgi:c-di-GMP-binding flagellar brake protein YcgR